MIFGGEGGIRTHVTVARKPHFECGAFDHSATSPQKIVAAGTVRCDPVGLVERALLAQPQLFAKRLLKADLRVRCSILHSDHDQEFA
jgi:hypothetical protein